MSESVENKIDFLLDMAGSLRITRLMVAELLRDCGKLQIALDLR